MTANGWFQIAFFTLLVLAVTKPLGVFMTRVFNREHTFMDPVLRPIERLVYRVTCVDENHEMRWTEYAVSVLLFSGVSMLALYFIMRLQAHLPFNPQKLAGVAKDLAFNTAASFTTNTNWQAYTPETTMSYLTQMAGLAYHNFISAAAGDCAGDCFHSRHSAPGDADHRQFLGGSGALLPLGVAADLDRGRAGAGVARRTAEL